MNSMKKITAKILSVAAVVAVIKRKTELIIIQLTNLKSFAVLERIIVSMAN